MRTITYQLLLLAFLTDRSGFVTPDAAIDAIPATCTMPWHHIKRQSMKVESGLASRDIERLDSSKTKGNPVSHINCPSLGRMSLKEAVQGIDATRWMVSSLVSLISG